MTVNLNQIFTLAVALILVIYIHKLDGEIDELQTEVVRLRTDSINLKQRLDYESERRKTLSLLTVAQQRGKNKKNQLLIDSLSVRYQEM